MIKDTGSSVPPANGTQYPEQNTFSILSEERPVNWRKYFFLFLTNWYWFIISLGIAIGASFYKIRYDIPLYQSSVKMIIEEEQVSNDILGEFRTVRYLRRQSEMANEVAKINSFSLIKRTLDSLDQTVFWTAHGRIRERPLYINERYEIELLSDSVNWYLNYPWFIDNLGEKKYRLYQENGIDTILHYGTSVDIKGWRFKINRISNSGGYNTYHFVVNDPIALTKYYKGKLKIEMDDNSGSIITLTSSGPVGQREVEFLNTLSQIYILSGLERKRSTAENSSRFIDRQINIILDSLKRAESQLLTFRISNNAIDLSTEGEMAYDKLKGFQDQKTSLKLKDKYYSYLYSYVEERKDPQTIISPTLTDANDQILINAVDELQNLYIEREALDIAVLEDNPGFENINERIRSTRIRILEIINGLIINNKLILDQIEIEEKAVLDQLRTLPQSEQQLLNIKRKYDLYNQFYTFLLQKRAESGIQKASTISNVHIIDQARVDLLIKVGVDKIIILLIAILLGLSIPAIVLVLRSLLENRIRDKEDITANSPIPIIGVVGHSDEKDLNHITKSPNSSFAESLRKIRTDLQFILREPDQKVIMVTSSVSGEGKTFIAANLAAIIAINNKKVLLVGCDMRKPTLHKIFKMENKVGLTSVIIESSELDDCIKNTHIDNLDILPSGPIPPNPSELIETDNMERVFKILLERYDIIVLDTPPLALVTDSLSLSKFANATLYAIRQDYSHKSVISIANYSYEKERLPNMNLVINDIKPKKSLGYSYYYGYGPGYNYSYYNNMYTKDYYDQN